MTIQQNNHPQTLISFFQDFYCHLLVHKQGVLVATQDAKHAERTLQNKALPTNPELGSGDNHKIHEEAERSLTALAHCLEQQAILAHQEGGDFASACYREAQYIMAVLADEIFLTLPWDGVKYWEMSLLEQRLFGTHIAGERFFQNLEAFLTQRNPLKGEIAVLYATALGLGFRGKFRGENDGGKIALYRDQLFTVMYHHKPCLFSGTSPLFTQAIANIAQRSPGKVVDIGRWRFIVFWGSVGLYLFCSWMIWYNGTSGLLRETRTIIEDVRAFS
jgi:type VI secretion system protein ImpK